MGESTECEESEEESSDPSDVDLQAKRRWYASLPWFVRGDVDGFAAVFSNNLATMLAGAQMLRQVLPREIVYGRIIPGVGISMAFGSFWYAVMALRKAASTRRTDLCAIPFGLNTPGVFAFNTGIIFAVYFKEGADDEAAVVAWQVGVVANFIQGLIEIILAPAGPYISSAVPMVALLGSLASVGLAWLFTNTLESEAFWPAVTFAPFFLLIAALFAGVSVPKLPSTLVPVALGGVLAWLFGKADAAAVREAMHHVGWFPATPDLEPFQHFDKVFGYLGIAIPVALTVAIGTIQVRQMAENAGDNYDLRWSMLGDGLGTVIASLFGSPWGMTVFIGHGAFKAMGAKIGYVVLCGLAFLVVCFSGLAALFLAVFPAQVLNPIILFVGLAVCVDALDVTPARHWPALLVSLVPGFCNWACESAASLAAAVCEQGFMRNGTVEKAKCAADPHGDLVWDLRPELRGLKAFGEGYLLISIFWATLIIHIVDRKFAHAAVWALIAAGAASCGLVHCSTVFLPWQGPPENSGKAMHWDFAAGYAISALVFALMWLAQSRGFVAAPLADSEANAEVGAADVGTLE